MNYLYYYLHQWRLATGLAAAVATAALTADIAFTALAVVVVTSFAATIVVVAVSATALVVAIVAALLLGRAEEVLLIRGDLRLIRSLEPGVLDRADVRPHLHSYPLGVI